MCDDIFNMHFEACRVKYSNRLKGVVQIGGLQSFMASEGNDVVDAFDGFQLQTVWGCTRTPKTQKSNAYLLLMHFPKTIHIVHQARRLSLT